MRFSRPLSLVSLCVALVLLAGCGGGGGGNEKVVLVKGKFLKGGKPYPLDISKLPPGDSGVVITFMSTTKPGDDHPARVNSNTMEFDIPGPKEKGIPPGSYKVMIQVGGFGNDFMRGQFTREKTPIVRDIQEGQEVIIDVDKP